MELFHFVVNFFKEGGFFLYPLAAIFVVGITIAIERFVYLTKETTINRRIWSQVVPLINQGNFKQVIAITSKSKAAIATALNYGIARLASARRRDDVEKAMDESLLEIIPRMEKRTHYLSALANIGMLTGLLGTVIGLISAFASIATANPAEKASLLAASISVAMNNTASGLFVA
ncbi:MAG: MotA/TolQ/ExbB proton channel family protein, partial [Povalibacter sp.]